MHFTMVSAYGEGAHLLHQIELEGNTVQLYIKDPYYRRIWDGLIPKVDKVEPPEGSVIIFDYSGMGALADELRAAGFATIGASKYADMLEQDRMGGLKIAEDAGVKVPFTVNFEGFDIEEVESFIAEYPDEKRWCFKPSGKGLPSCLTYCAKNSEDLLGWVRYVEKSCGKNIESFILQEFIEGVAVSSEAWCDGKRFLKPFVHDVEIKAFMNDNLGASTGCSGNVIWLEHDPCRIVEEGIGRMERAIVESGHVGPVDINAIVNESGLYFLEWTPRMGYSSMPTTIKLIQGGVGKLFSDVARGQGGTLNFMDKLAVAVKLTIPPYPIEPEHAKDVQVVSPNVGMPIRGIPEGMDDSFYWYEIELEDDQLVHSVGSGVIADVVGLGDDCMEAFERPYEILEDMVLPNKQYRTDLPEVLGKMYEEAMEQEHVKIGVAR